MSDARSIAFRVLVDVEKGAYSNLALKDALPALSERDRALATNLVYTTLRNRRWIDHALSGYLRTEPKDVRVRVLLRLGAAQILLFDRVPDSAACNETVNLARAQGRSDQSGFLNGVLRALAREKEKWNRDAFEPQSICEYALKFGWPDWIAEMWARDYGEGAAHALLRGGSFSETTLRVNPLIMPRPDFPGALTGKLAPEMLRVRGIGDLTQLPEYRAGRVSAQSESAYLACKALDPRRDEKILDACAAPGGKTCALAELSGDRAHIRAWDIHPHRVALIENAAKRLRLCSIRTATHDAKAFVPEMEGTLDAVLIDAPCSGLGVATEKPELRFRVTAGDIAALVEEQRRILDACCRYVRPGGRLVYATCTATLAENRDQVRAFLHAHAEFSPLAIEGFAPSRSEEGVQLFPSDAGEGFYIAKLVRREE